MKIKKIIQLCKQSSTVALYDTQDEQWLSDGFSIYPLFNLPIFDEDTLCRTYDITEKQQNDFIIRHEHSLPLAYSFKDAIDEENEIQRGSISLYDGKRKIIPFETSQGVAFIDEKYLSPLSDNDYDVISVWERETPNGELYFAVKCGFILSAIIMPVKVINADFMDKLKSLYLQCDTAYQNSTERDDKQCELC